MLTAALGWAQEPSQPVEQEPPFLEQQAQPAAQNPPATAQATVHGVVRNAATGEPLPRALVRIEGDADTGALTDGEGRFEIPCVPLGPQTFTVAKPGFSSKVERGDYEAPVMHVVHVAAETPELAFSLMPGNALSGRVTLSSGEPGAGINVTLLKLKVEDGRAHWTEGETHQSTPEGTFRFSGLEDGSYTLMTQPEFDNERASAPACDGPAPVALSGYPIVFFPDAADVAGAERIHIEGGRQAQANLTLTLSPFHAVLAALSKLPAGGHPQFISTLMNRNGQPLGYPLRQDEKSHSYCAYLPDGAYTLTVAGSTDSDDSDQLQPPSRQARKPKLLAGSLDFTVEGHAQTHLRIPLSAGVSTPVHLRYEPGPPAARQPEGVPSPEGAEPEANALGLWAERANAVGARNTWPLSADWVDAGLYDLSGTAPGAYWIHAGVNRPGTCLGAVTAGGVNLAREPWMAGTLGTGPAIEAVVRTDCARLTLQLPAALLDQQPGEEQTLYAYVVPEFDSIEPVRETPIRPSAGATVTLENLTPGAYRVFVFDSPRSLEYRNPAALERVAAKSQSVTLAPNGSANLVLEIPSR